MHAKEEEVKGSKPKEGLREMQGKERRINQRNPKALDNVLEKREMKNRKFDSKEVKTKVNV